MKRNIKLTIAITCAILVSAIIIWQINRPYLTRIELPIDIEIWDKIHGFDWRTEYMFKIYENTEYETHYYLMTVYDNQIHDTDDYICTLDPILRFFKSDDNLTIEVYKDNTKWKTFDVILPRIMSDKILLDIDNCVLPVNSFMIIYDVNWENVEVEFERR